MLCHQSIAISSTNFYLVISPPPNCSPPPLLVYKMVAYVMAPQDRPSSSEVIPATRSVAYHQHRKSLPVSSEVILATTFRTTRASISPSQAECHLGRSNPSKTPSYSLKIISSKALWCIETLMTFTWKTCGLKISITYRVSTKRSEHNKVKHKFILIIFVLEMYILKVILNNFLSIN
jgi:hypothetical protein